MKHHVYGLFATAFALSLSLPLPSEAVSLEVEARPQHAAVDALPILGLVKTRSRVDFRLRGKITKRRARWAKQMVTLLVQDVQKRFLNLPGDQRGLEAAEQVEVCLFESNAAYRRFVTEVFGPDRFQHNLGFYAPYHRLLAADLSRDPASLKHELIHPLLADAGGFPLWLEEGLAELYAGASLTKGKLCFGAKHRLGILRSAKRSGRLPGPEELAGADDRVLYGGEGLPYYALARFVLLYLQRQDPVRLERFVADMRKTTQAQERTDVIHKHLKWSTFLDWMEKIEANKPPRGRRK